MNPYASLSPNVAVLSDVTTENKNAEHIRDRSSDQDTFSQDLVRLCKSFLVLCLCRFISILAFGGASDKSRNCVPQPTTEAHLVVQFVKLNPLAHEPTWICTTL